MAKAGNRATYRRIRTGLGSTDMLGRQQSLWLAEDHLLVVDDTYLVRTVTRTDLRDIEAVVVCPTRVYVWTTVGAGGLYLVGGSLCLAASFGWVVLGLGLAVPCLLIVLANLVRGPTCVCDLQTRVTTRRLRALRRRRQAERFLARVGPLIRAAQAGATVPGSGGQGEAVPAPASGVGSGTTGPATAEAPAPGEPS